MSVLIIDNPLERAVSIFEELYPDIDVEVCYVQGMYKKVGAFGETFWPDDGSDAVISLDVDVSMLAFLDVFVHELAHVAAGKGNGHNNKWEEAFEEMNSKFNEAQAIPAN